MMSSEARVDIKSSFGSSGTSTKSSQIDGLVKYYEDDGIPAEIVAFVYENTSPPSSGLRKLVIRMAEHMFPYGRCRKAQGLFSYRVPP
jgi:hypothetical protein